MPCIWRDAGHNFLIFKKLCIFAHINRYMLSNKISKK